MSALDLAERHAGIRADVRRFAGEVILAQRARIETPGHIEVDVLRQAAAAGWIGHSLPADVGGQDAGALSRVIMLEELACHSGAMAAAVQASQLGAAPIDLFGSPGQRADLLPKVAAGRCLPSIAVTEKAAGGTIGEITTTAEHRGGRWHLSGHKTLVGNSHVADVHVVVARTAGPEAGFRALSAFLVPATRDGVHLVPYAKTPKTALHGFSYGDIVFTDCVLDADDLLGEEGDGMLVAQAASTLIGRLNLAAVTLGLHHAIVAHTVTHLLDKPRYGSDLAHHPVIEQHIGAMTGDLDSAQVAVYEAAAQLDQGRRCDTRLMNAKRTAVARAEDSALQARRLHGGHATAADIPLASPLRDIPAMDAPAGTTFVQQLRLGRAATGADEHPQMSERFPRARRPAAATASLTAA